MSSYPVSGPLPSRQPSPARIVLYADRFDAVQSVQIPQGGFLFPAKGDLFTSAPIVLVRYQNHGFALMPC